MNVKIVIVVVSVIAIGAVVVAASSLLRVVELEQRLEAARNIKTEGLPPRTSADAVGPQTPMPTLENGDIVRIDSTPAPEPNPEHRSILVEVGESGTWTPRRLQGLSTILEVRKPGGLTWKRDPFSHAPYEPGQP